MNFDNFCHIHVRNQHLLFKAEFGIPSQSELLEGCWPVAKEVTLSETDIKTTVPGIFKFSGL